MTTLRPSRHSSPHLELESIRKLKKSDWTLDWVVEFVSLLLGSYPTIVMIALPEELGKLAKAKRLGTPLRKVHTHDSYCNIGSCEGCEMFDDEDEINNGSTPEWD